MPYKATYVAAAAADSLNFYDDKEREKDRERDTHTKKEREYRCL